MTAVEAGLKCPFSFYFSISHGLETSYLGKGLSQPYYSLGLCCANMLPKVVIFVRWVQLLAADQPFLNSIHAGLEAND